MWRNLINPDKLTEQSRNCLDSLVELIPAPKPSNSVHAPIAIHEWVGRGVLEGILSIEEYMEIGAELRQKGSNRLH